MRRGARRAAREALPDARELLPPAQRGLVLGDSARDARPRCQLYATYFERHLL